MKLFDKLRQFMLDHEPFKRKDGKIDRCSFAPDVVFGVDLEMACLSHDEGYAQENDLAFREDIKFLFNQQNKKVLGWIVANIYYIAVYTFRRIFYRSTLNG